mgnify:CR=1 FL=1
MLFRSGGGGYGSPLKRPIERVAFDLAEGYISTARAEQCYGAVLTSEGSLDLAASAVRREAMLQAEVPYEQLPEPDEDAMSEADEKLFTQARGFFWRRCC